MVQLSEWRNVSTSVLTQLQTSFGFHQILFFFSLASFSVPGSRPGHHSAFHHHISSASSWLTVAQFSLFFLTFTFGRVLARHLQKGPFIWVWLMSFHDQTVAMGFGGNHGGDVPSWRITPVSTCCPQDLSLMVLTWITWPGYCLPGFSTTKRPSPSTPHSLEACGHVQSILPEGRV